jgi:hypothetical protein
MLQPARSPGRSGHFNYWVRERTLRYVRVGSDNLTPRLDALYRPRNLCRRRNGDHDDYIRPSRLGCARTINVGDDDPRILRRRLHGVSKKAERIGVSIGLIKFKSSMQRPPSGGFFVCDLAPKPDQRIARSPDGIKRDAGLGLTAMAFDL